MVMDCHRGSGFAGGNVIEIQSGITENDVNENWGLGSVDQAVSATKDGMWNRETSFDTKSKSSHEGRLFQFEVESQPPNKRARNSPLMDLTASDRSKAIGKMFYKTKLCCKFQVGACPFIKTCNFAHGIEELREPPPNWQEIVAAHKEEQAELSEPREVFQIPILGFSDEIQGPNMRQHCRKFFTEEGCQYGENCNFIHDEHYKDRESVAICLLPGTGGGHGGSGSKSTLNSSNWKTKICKKWELTGCCPFGSKCHFAHGSAELQRYGGGLMKTEAKDSSTCDTKQVAVPAKASVGKVDAPVTSVPHSYRTGVPSRRLPNVIQKTGEIPTRRWKGPNKISKIYGDWIDDLE
ncbi:hypothetical protein Pfo_001216 [Paulownia fortunei]|nr:hypothetical protein Pfo_001216 [Paulownia fortunei]